MGFFYVQNLVYDDMGGTDEWLNWDSVMQRLAWNIPDPIHESEFEEKLDEIWSISPHNREDKKAKIDDALRNFFHNDEQEWTEEVIRKIKEEDAKPLKDKNWSKVGVQDWTHQRIPGTPQYRGEDGTFSQIRNKRN